MLPCSFLGHSPMGYTTEAARRPSPPQFSTSQCWLESKDQLRIFASFRKAWAANSALAKLCLPAGRSFWLHVQMSMFRSELCFLNPDFGRGHPEIKVSWIRRPFLCLWERTLHDTPGVLPGLCHLVANLHFFSAANHGKRKVDLQKGKGQ